MSIATPKALLKKIIINKKAINYAKLFVYAVAWKINENILCGLHGGWDVRLTDFVGGVGKFEKVIFFDILIEFVDPLNNKGELSNTSDISFRTHKSFIFYNF